MRGGVLVAHPRLDREALPVSRLNAETHFFYANFLCLKGVDSGDCFRIFQAWPVVSPFAIEPKLA